MGGRGSYSAVSRAAVVTAEDLKKIEPYFGLYRPSDYEGFLKAAKEMGLTEAEGKLLYSYTDGLYTDLNYNLKRDKNGATTFTKDKLNALLDKLPDYKGTTWRKAGFGESEYQLINRLKKGDFEFKNFTSTSSSYEAAYKFHVGFTKATKVIFEIESKHGKAVSKIAMEPKEQEILFKAGSRFRYVSNYTQKNYLHIKIKEV